MSSRFVSSSRLFIRVHILLLSITTMKRIALSKCRWDIGMLIRLIVISFLTNETRRHRFLFGTEFS